LGEVSGKNVIFFSAVPPNAAHRVDYSHGPLYTYFDSRGSKFNFPEVTAEGAGVFHHDIEGFSFTAIPDVNGKFSGRYTLRFPRGNFVVYAGSIDATIDKMIVVSELTNAVEFQLNKVEYPKYYFKYRK
jgi:hypothetical protein